MRAILMTSAVDPGVEGWDSTYGAGLVNAANAISIAMQPASVACMNNADCADADSCTVDECVNGGTQDAYCINDISCGPADGCCDPDCGESDPDCGSTATCGDGFCTGATSGEDCNSCSFDCPAFKHPVPGSACCGDGACEGKESSNNCPVDCL